MAKSKITWTKTDIANIIGIEGDYRKLSKIIEKEVKDNCNYTRGQQSFSYLETKQIIISIVPFLEEN